MNRAIVSGTSINRSRAFEGWECELVETAFGSVEARRRGTLIALNRHGFRSPLPPHAINYRANIAALEALEARQVITLSSVGSLDRDLPPGAMVSCGDYISFAPKTFVDDRMSAFAPVVTNPLLDEIAGTLRHPVQRNKIYAQTPGPRFETRAEVRALRAWGADVVGMTFANEADLMLERGMEITAFCMVDNFAHGVADAPLTMGAFQALVAANQAKVDAFLAALVELYEE